MPPASYRAPDHEAGDILQENQRYAALAGQFDEVDTLQGALGEQHAVVGQDGHRLSPDMGEAGDERRPVERLELVEAGSIDDACDHLAHLVGRAHVRRNDAVELIGIVRRRFGRPQVEHRAFPEPKVSDQGTDDRKGVLVVRGDMIDNAAPPRVRVRPAEVLGADHLAGGRLHQRRAGQEDGPLPPHDDRLVAHRRDVGSARGARAHHAGDLRNARSAHARLVEEDAPEVVAVGKDLRLVRQVRPAAVDQIDAREVVLLSDLLARAGASSRSGGNRRRPSPWRRWR